ncbi:exopolysaccharide biosynthesis protein [Rhizobium helianthi]|uniref:Exopolysaccharide biosynthesis protein n=1 Tax=Rhizobium helianthi TaxID=1132695 RepID=A0ABW4M6P4_9HYPH
MALPEPLPSFSEPDDRKAPEEERPQSFSHILRALADDVTQERIAVSDLLLAMKDRAFGALLFIFAMPNTIPTPPGTSAILGIPLVFLSLQMALGKKPWLPQLIAKRSMLRSDFAGMVGKIEPWIAKAERMLKPRLSALASPGMEKAIGIFCLILSIILALPIPLGNMLPAVALCIMAFGILEKDGLWVMLGIGLGIVSLFLVAGVIYAIFKAILFFAASIFT